MKILLAILLLVPSLGSAEEVPTNSIVIRPFVWGFSIGLTNSTGCTVTNWPLGIAGLNVKFGGVLETNDIGVMRGMRYVRDDFYTLENYNTNDYPRISELTFDREVIFVASMTAVLLTVSIISICKATKRQEPTLMGDAKKRPEILRKIIRAARN